ncbi:MAG: hypothetical protein IJ859_07595, partial [Synergistaceae bacterium]|nr:hypothetical protein [Synergistaceae bacterium]
MEKLKQIKIWAIEQVIWAERELKGKSGTEKKAAVIKKLDDLIKLPFYLEWVDDIVLSWIVDAACERLNKFAGHKFANIILDEAQEEKLADDIEVLRGFNNG